MIATSFRSNYACGIYRLNIHIICTVLKTAIYTFIELNKLCIHLIELNRVSIPHECMNVLLASDYVAIVATSFNPNLDCAPNYGGAPVP